MFTDPASTFVISSADIMKKAIEINSLQKLKEIKRGEHSSIMDVWNVLTGKAFSNLLSKLAGLVIGTSHLGATDVRQGMAFNPELVDVSALESLLLYTSMWNVFNLDEVPRLKLWQIPPLSICQGIRYPNSSLTGNIIPKSEIIEDYQWKSISENLKKCTQANTVTLCNKQHKEKMKRSNNNNYKRKAKRRSRLIMIILKIRNHLIIKSNNRKIRKMMTIKMMTMIGRSLINKNKILGGGCARVQTLL